MFEIAFLEMFGSRPAHDDLLRGNNNFSSKTLLFVEIPMLQWKNFKDNFRTDLSRSPIHVAFISKSMTILQYQ